MRRLVFVAVAAALLFILFFLGLNLFDTRPAPAALGAGATRMPAANLEPGNLFFVVWGFAEPPETHPLSPEYRLRVLELFTPRSRPFQRLSRSPYGQWLALLNDAVARHWQGAIILFPKGSVEELGEHFASQRGRIGELELRFAPLLSRFRRLLGAGALLDFTPVNWDCPPRSLQLATFAAKLYAAAAMLAALDGDWPAAGTDLLAAADAGFKLIASGRTLGVNALGKSMVELSLRALASLLNHPQCPPEFARLVVDRLPELPIQSFGTGPVREFNWLRFASSLARVKKDRIVDPTLLKDYFRDPKAFYVIVSLVGINRMRLFNVTHALAAFFIKENESLVMMRNFWDEVGALENAPPWRWRAGPVRRRRSLPATSGPFWWLRNPLGKMMVQSAAPYYWLILQKYVYRSRELQVRYDLTRLLAQARLASERDGGLGGEELGRLLAVAALDPFSGRPFRYGRGSATLYSLGADAEDDGGRERLELWRDSDIAVPIRFVSRDS